MTHLCRHHLDKILGGIIAQVTGTFACTESSRVVNRNNKGQRKKLDQIKAHKGVLFDFNSNTCI